MHLTFSSLCVFHQPSSALIISLSSPVSHAFRIFDLPIRYCKIEFSVKHNFFVFPSRAQVSNLNRGFFLFSSHKTGPFSFINTFPLALVFGILSQRKTAAEWLTKVRHLLTGTFHSNSWLGSRTKIQCRYEMPYPTDGPRRTQKSRGAIWIRNEATQLQSIQRRRSPMTKTDWIQSWFQYKGRSSRPEPFIFVYGCISRQRSEERVICLSCGKKWQRVPWL